MKSKEIKLLINIVAASFIASGLILALLKHSTHTLSKGTAFIYNCALPTGMGLCVLGILVYCVDWEKLFFQLAKGETSVLLILTGVAILGISVLETTLLVLGRQDPPLPMVPRTINIFLYAFSILFAVFFLKRQNWARLALIVFFSFQFAFLQIIILGIIIYMSLYEQMQWVSALWLIKKILQLFAYILIVYCLSRPIVKDKCV